MARTKTTATPSIDPDNKITKTKISRQIIPKLSKSSVKKTETEESNATSQIVLPNTDILSVNHNSATKYEDNSKSVEDNKITSNLPNSIPSISINNKNIDQNKLYKKREYSEHGYEQLKNNNGDVRLKSSESKTMLPNSSVLQNNYKINELEAKTIAELRSIAISIGLEGVGELNKHDLILRILSIATQNQGNNIPVEGILEIMTDNTHGILRSMKLIPSENDVYVSLSQIRRFNMRMGDYVVGLARLPKDNERYLSLLRVDSINGTKAEEATNRPYFEKMTPIFPNRLMNIESDPETLSTRLIDMLSPIGYGQRGMVVAPPKAGKTWLLKDIAKGISHNHPDIHLMVVLIAERPEEVTDMARFVKGEVFSANFDDSAEVQVKVAELSLERAKRMVESGYDVVILLDSITRLARAYNVVMPTSGRTLSGGMDPIALYPPKRFFGAARNFEVGKSLTIIATALVDTGSKMDDVVFEEFKGTGNMELHLDRSLAERRVYPSVNIKESSTRNEELLLGRENLAKIWGIRRLIDEMKPIDAINAISDRLKKTKTNQLFLDTIHEII